MAMPPLLSPPGPGGGMLARKPTHHDGHAALAMAWRHATKTRQAARAAPKGQEPRLTKSEALASRNQPTYRTFATTPSSTTPPPVHPNPAHLANLPSSRFLSTPSPLGSMIPSDPSLPMPPGPLASGNVSFRSVRAHGRRPLPAPPTTPLLPRGHPTSATNKPPGISWPTMLFPPLPASVPN